MDQALTKILVVEDEEALRFSLREGLEMFGHQADAAAGLREAHECIAETRYDLVLTDLNLIGESGLDLIKTLREDGFEGGIIVMTAFGSIDSAVKAIRLGADEYVQLTTCIGYYAMLAMTVNGAELEPNPQHEALEV